MLMNSSGSISRPVSWPSNNNRNGTWKPTSQGNWPRPTSQGNGTWKPTPQGNWPKPTSQGSGTWTQPPKGNWPKPPQMSNHNWGRKPPYREDIMNNFPTTNFYLPNLRKWFTRLVPIGWLNEVWKNMTMLQYENDIICIDGGMQFPQAQMLWAKYSIPDISFLLPLKKNVRAFFITHAHLDHIWTLKHLLPALWMPPVYATKLTIGLIKKHLDEHNLLTSAKLIEVNPDKCETHRVGFFKVEMYRVNHNIPDAAWLYIETPNAKIVHTWDFKFDMTPAIDKPADLARIGRIWERGVTLLMSDSTNSTKKWFTKTEKEIWDSLSKIIENHTRWRMVIATFSSLIWRVQQIIDACEKHWKQIYLSGRSMIENVKIARDLWFINCKSWTLKKLTEKSIGGVSDDKQIIITTWSQGEEFSALYRMAEWTHNAIDVRPWDSVVLSSKTIPWNELKVIEIMNKLIRLWANLMTNDELDIHASWHAAQEEQKLMINLVRPRYFMPIHGELYMRVAHKKTAIELWIPRENTILCDNGSIVEIDTEWKVYKSKIHIPLKEVIVDGHGIWTAGSHVIKAREKMMNSWVLVILFNVSWKSRKLLDNVKLETRWLVYLDEVRQIHKIVIKKARSVYENTVNDIPEIDEKDLIKIIKTDLETYLLQKLDRDPMIIPLIISGGK